MEDIDRLCENISYQFRDKELLECALTHRSYAHEAGLSTLKHNERLEFLGDAVLEIVVSDHLYKSNPEMPEGELTKLRAALVCEPTLADCANKIKLGSYIRLSKGEASSGGRGRKSILSDAFEAVIGAIYLDSGMEEAASFIHSKLLDEVDTNRLFCDSKSRLQEKVQGEHLGVISYRVVGESGPDHAKRFDVEVRLGDRVIGTGTGSSKKSAEQEAARMGLEKICI